MRKVGTTITSGFGKLGRGNEAIPFSPSVNAKSIFQCKKRFCWKCWFTKTANVSKFYSFLDILVQNLVKCLGKSY